MKAGDEEAEVANMAKWHLTTQPENQVFAWSMGRQREPRRSGARFLEPTAGAAILLDFSVTKKHFCDWLSPFESRFSDSCS